MRTEVFRVENLQIAFSQYERGFRRKDIVAVRDLSVSLYAGEILSVVGASGSGKSLLAHGILSVLPKNAKQSGKFFYRGHSLEPSSLKQLRGKTIALIPQSVEHLDPLIPVWKQVARSNSGAPLSFEAVTALFEKYNMTKDAMRLYPFQLSGGMARKVLLMMALSQGAEIIIADEPTPGLDEKALLEVLNDFKSLARQGHAVLLITHDIFSAVQISDELAMFHGGVIVERAKKEAFLNGGDGLVHPYTKALVRALPTEGMTHVSPSVFPVTLNGCAFRSLCQEPCEKGQRFEPQLRAYANGEVRCHGHS